MLIVVFALPRNVFLAAPNTDAVSYYISARAFAAENPRAGHRPLWNPYIYAGMFAGHLPNLCAMAWVP